MVFAILGTIVSAMVVGGGIYLLGRVGTFSHPGIRYTMRDN